MGLTIHYSLRAQCSEAKAFSLVTQLHQAAHDLSFKELGEIVDLSGDACDYNKRNTDDPLRWALIQAAGDVRVKGTHCMGDSFVNIVPTQVICFTAWPGEGCEESNFGLCQYPEEIYDRRFGTIESRLSGWHWKSFCKTQFASSPGCGGVANFLRCHLTVIALLDKARELRLLNEVHDEGGFWEKRDVPALVNEIGSWNELFAAFGGKLKDVLGDGVESAMSEYPNFEQLVAAGQDRLPPETETLARLIQQVVKERRAW
jgi:hypothetical protein